MHLNQGRSHDFSGDAFAIFGLKVIRLQIMMPLVRPVEGMGGRAVSGSIAEV